MLERNQRNLSLLKKLLKPKLYHRILDRLKGRIIYFPKKKEKTQRTIIWVYLAARPPKDWETLLAYSTRIAKKFGVSPRYIRELLRELDKARYLRGYVDKNSSII